MKRGVLLLVLFAAFAVCTSRSTFAQDKQGATAAEERARKLFFQGTKLVDERNYEAALAKFRAAYDLVPRAKILINIALVLVELERDAEAANYFQRYLRHPDFSRKRVAEVRRTLARLDERLGRIMLDIDVRDAKVRIDGQEIGESPLRVAWRVTPGPHEVAVHVSGDAWERTEEVSVAANEQVAVTVRRERDVPTAEERVADNGSETPAPPRSRNGPLSAFLRTDFDLVLHGVVLAPGLSMRFLRRWHAFASALIGGNGGFEVGTRLALGDGSIRPIAVLALPVFFDQGARPGGRVAAGLGWSRWRAHVMVEIGAAYALSAPENHQKRVFLGSVTLEISM